ncbi:MAG: hypothetical protein ABI675_07540 [Chitinophagaceae bacterium]
MQVIADIPLYCLPVILAFFAGDMARNSGCGYKFWVWVFIPLPLISHFILLALPEKGENYSPILHK